MSALCPIDIQFGSLDDLKDVISLCSKKTIIIAERYTSSLWEIEDLITYQVSSGQAIWIDSVSPNPTQRDVSQILEILEKEDCQHILAIGGGSVLDMAKAVSTFTWLCRGKSCDISKITEVIKSKAYQSPHRMLSITAVPSTAGTGSEMTPWATIWDDQKKAKYSIEDDSLYVKKALIIPELTLSMPSDLTVSTALDALSHASEAFWARQTSPVVKDISIRAIELIMTYLKPTLEQPLNLKLRGLMMRGALLAGMAFSKTHTTACHAISYPITMHYNVPHGIASAMTLDSISKINRPVIEDSEMLFQTYEKHGGLKSWLDLVCDGVVSLRLRDYGISIEAIKSIASGVFTKGRMDNNPVDLTSDIVCRILRDIF